MINESLTTLTLPYDDSRTKTVRVFVPAHGEGEKFPVIYMTDGQNLFDEESSSFGSWHTREAVRAELESGGRGAVIVGIHNDEDPKTRASELMPKGIGTLVGPEEIIRSFTPAGEAFDSFVIDTVIPEIEKSFPVLTGRENTAFCGSSSGGMMSLFTALGHPDVYGAAGVLSPALMAYQPDDWFRWLSSSLRGEKPYLYLYSGGADKMEQVILQVTEMACGMLSQCYPEKLFKKVIKPGQRHNEAAWEPEFREFLHIFLNRTWEQ